MFDNSLNKLTNAIPEEMKDKLKESAMEKLGLSKSESVRNSETAAPRGEKADQAPSETQAQDDTAETNETTQITSPTGDSAQPEPTDEDIENAA